MNSRSPVDAGCPFCRFAAGDDISFNAGSDIVHDDSEVMAFISPRWWPNNPGNVIVIPRRHFANLYDLTDDLWAEIALVAKRIADAMKAIYRCDGASLRQHNEPAGGQDVFHVHRHVFPRWIGDDLYRNTDNHRFAPIDERRPNAERLRSFLDAGSAMG